MKTTLKTASFTFIGADLNEYEVRVEPGNNGMNDFSILVNGNYKHTYSFKMRIAQAGAEKALQRHLFI